MSDIEQEVTEKATTQKTQNTDESNGNDKKSKKKKNFVRINHGMMKVLIIGNQSLSVKRIPVPHPWKKVPLRLCSPNIVKLISERFGPV